MFLRKMTFIKAKLAALMLQSLHSITPSELSCWIDASTAGVLLFGLAFLCHAVVVVVVVDGGTVNGMTRASHVYWEGLVMSDYLLHVSLSGMGVFAFK